MKKLISKMLIIGSALFISNSAMATPAQFKDLYNANPYATAIQYLQNEGVIEGYQDGTFASEKAISRAEFLKIVMESSGKEAKGDNCYKDVKDEWFAKYVCGATEAGIVNGYSDNTFKPEQEINFAEASKIIVNSLKLKLAAAENDKWYASFEKTLELKKAIPAEINSSNHTLTRGEMAELIWRLKTGKNYKVSNTFSNLEAGIAVNEYGNNLKTFDSCEQLNNFLTDHTQNFDNYNYWKDDMILTNSAERESTASETSMESPSLAKSVNADATVNTEHSETNVQVKGVDEADIIKNDGEYIYVVKGKTVRVIDARDPKNLKEIKVIELNDKNFTPEEMYVDDRRLVITGYSNTSYWKNNRYTSLQNVYSFNIKNKENITLVKELKLEGNLVTSRKINNTLYMVMENYIPYKWDETPIPLYQEDEDNTLIKTAKCGEVQYMPGIIGEPHYITVYAINVEHEENKVKSSVIIGNADTVYASKDNLYITDYEYGNIMNSRSSIGLAEPYIRQPDETYIHKFSLNEGDIKYEGVGPVPGTINNQFSLDESGKDLRVVTTKSGQWWNNSKSTNNVYILNNETMEIEQSLEGLAEGEKVYSARFVGNKVYIVTFKQIDPLFVIDLGSVSANIAPTVLGQLKIPGVSKYIHPIDEDHIIGFGLDAVENESENNAWFQGIKISMFDVSDVKNPKEVDTVIIGDRGTSSELEYNHKALLIDTKKGFLSFPVTVAEIPQEVKDNLKLNTWQYGDTVFQGAYIYDFDVNKGFKLRGKISHYDKKALGSNFHYYDSYEYGKDIKRIIYMGKNFFTMSEDFIKATTMTELKEVDMLKLKQIGEDNNPNYEKPIPMIDTTVEK